MRAFGRCPFRRNEVCLIKFSFKWRSKYFIWKLRCSANFWHLDQCFQWVQHTHLSAACLGASIWSLNFSYSRSAKLKHFSVFFNVVYGCFHHLSNYLRQSAAWNFKKKCTLLEKYFLFRYCLLVKNQAKIVMFGHPEHFW